MADDLQREYDALVDRRSFGLNFERHMPEVVELPGRPVRKGDKVRILAPRGESPTAENDRLWRVTAVETEDDGRRATLVSLDDAEDDASVAVEDLVVVAEFRDPIYPGLVSTGSIERGGDKPFHTVINAENYHALETLLFTHRGKIDCIYIDPPYNTGARDWKYNNDYVDGDDHYRHSQVAGVHGAPPPAREGAAEPGRLRPDRRRSTRTRFIDSACCSRQVFPEARTQLVINRYQSVCGRRARWLSHGRGICRLCVLIGAATPRSGVLDNLIDRGRNVRTTDACRWESLLRRGRTLGIGLTAEPLLPSLN